MVTNYLTLRDLAPDLPFVPVLQGFDLPDYLHCADLYQRAGIELGGVQVVGVGSVCRRQGTRDAAAIMTALCQQLPGVRLHGFGIKTSGLHQYGALLASADSMAWSYGARRTDPLPECTGHKNCANCLTYALGWRTKVLDAMTTHHHTISTRRRDRGQLALFDLEDAA
ncbi:deazapurine DNA modification protein DpdA family protein [Nocardia harenae]|uniref:deazapurine DNA modification protein DpdA family protein n=1 Tax=Nocardia harenae TaxID=358707 RepID=UPI00082B79D8|nr:hypothetical protein [Nocardia harenae]